MSSPDKSSRLLNMNEVASALGVSAKTVRRLTIRKKIPHFRIGTVYRFELEEVLGALRSRQYDEANRGYDAPPLLAKRRTNFIAEKNPGRSRKSNSATRDDAKALFNLLLAKQRRAAREKP